MAEIDRSDLVETLRSHLWLLQHIEMTCLAMLEGALSQFVRSGQPVKTSDCARSEGQWRLVDNNSSVFGEATSFQVGMQKERNMVGPFI